MRAMTAKHTQNDSKTIAKPVQGFANWSPVFTTGEHTDMRGQRKTWTRADLDALVRNLKPRKNQPFTVPVVKGHPANDAPAYAWVQALKRKGDVLYARYHNVDPAFAEEVSTGRFPNRSIAIHSTDNGPALKHVGFLGAALPAIDDLPAMFAQAKPGDDAASLWLFSQATADADMPTGLATKTDLSTMQTSTATTEVQTPEVQNPHPDQSQDQVQDQPPVITESDVQAAAEKARAELQAEFTKQQASMQARIVELERERLVATHQKTIDAAIVAGAITPAQAAGCAEFMASLESNKTTQTFCFSAADGSTSETNASAFFTTFIDKLGAGQTLAVLADDTTAPSQVGLQASRLEIHEKAMAYSQENECDYVLAVKAVTGQ